MPFPVLQDPPALPPRSVALVLLGLSLSACVLNPVDGQEVTSTSSPISFAGYSNTGNQTVELRTGRGSTWQAAGQAMTTASPTYTTPDGVPLYSWNINASIAEDFWSPGITGRFTKVRALALGGSPSGDDAEMTTFLSDWSACYGEHGSSLARFLARCKSPNSPDAYIYTSDYPKGVDLELLSLRASPDGQLVVTVRNGGRPGRLTSLACFGAFATMSVTNPNVDFAPGVAREFRVQVALRGRVRCNVRGQNPDGSPESNQANNSKIQPF